MPSVETAWRAERLVGRTKRGQAANERLGYLRLFKWPLRTPAQHWLEVRRKLPHGTCGGAFIGGTARQISLLGKGFVPDIPSIPCCGEMSGRWLRVNPDQRGAHPSGNREDACPCALAVSCLTEGGHQDLSQTVRASGRKHRARLT